MTQILYQSEKLTEGSNRDLRGRPWEEQKAMLFALAEAALDRCKLKATQMKQVGHMGNFGYSDFALSAVTEGADPSHLVSVHYPYDGTSIDEVHRHVNSLCLWLKALGQDTDLEVQVPLADEEGELCQQHDHRPQGPEAVCTVQRWVKGRDIVSEDEERNLVDLPEDTMHALGVLLGRIHGHGAAWPRPEGFRRPQIDWISDVVELEREVERGHLNRTEQAILQRTVEVIVRNREVRGEPWGLTHGDFRPGNCVEDHGCFKAIDFDLCALTYQFDDVGWCFARVEGAEMRSAFLEGYRSTTPVPEDFERLVEGALIAARVRLWSWGSPKPGGLQAECEKYLSGQGLLCGASANHSENNNQDHNRTSERGTAMAG